jgi:hypothetical protein
MKKIVFILCLVGFYLDSSSQKIASNLSMNKNEFILKVEMEREFTVGENVPFVLSLLSKKNKVEIYDLETAWLYFEIEPYINENYQSMQKPGWYKTTGGTYRYNIDNTGEIQLLNLKQNIVKVENNVPISKKYELNSLMQNGFVYPGNYKLIIIYEWQLKDSITFYVRPNYSKGIPVLMKAIESSVIYGNTSGVQLFYYLTGYLPEQKLGDVLEDFKIAPKLRQWWQEHKDLILKIESTLNQEQYKNLHYGDKVPDLIKHLKSINYQERLAARDTLVQITGMPDWKPSSQDTDDEIKKVVDEVQQWWNKNKELITWINRVIFDSRI